MSFDTFKNMTVAQLYHQAADLKKESLNIRILAASDQPTNTNRMRNIRRDVARIKTRIKQLRESA